VQLADGSWHWKEEFEARVTPDAVRARIESESGEGATGEY
jgi:hypothetical protein